MKDLRLLSLLGNFDMLRNAAMLFDFMGYKITLCFFDCGDIILAGMGCRKLGGNYKLFPNYCTDLSILMMP
jgi:hypothetical protein